MSCHGFQANQVRLRLHVLVYNLGDFVRRLALPASVKHCPHWPPRVGCTGQSGADTPLRRPACDGIAVVTQRGPVNLLPVEGSAVACCAHGDGKHLRAALRAALGPSRGGSRGCRAKRAKTGLTAGQGCVTLVYGKPGMCWAGFKLEMSDHVSLGEGP
jgi:hypothetical protein